MADARAVRERREKILLLMSRGYNQQEIVNELKTTRRTICRDMATINQWTKKGLFEQAKATLPTIYFNSLTAMNELVREVWYIYNTLKPEFQNTHDKYVTANCFNAIRLLGELNDKKFGMFQNGPTMMEVTRMEDEVKKIKEDLLEETGRKPFGLRRLPFRDPQLDK